MGRFDSEERDVRRYEDGERANVYSVRDVSDLLVSLDADDPKRRASAAWALAEVAANAPERVPVPDLMQAITDDDQWVRRGATWALAEVAQSNPADAKPAMKHVPELVEDGDPLVRENAVVTVAGVAETYPRSAEPVFGSLFSLRDEGSGTVRRYATEAIRHISNALSGATLDGQPVVISVSDPETAAVFPVGANVVQSGRGGPETGGIRIEPASDVDSPSTSKPSSGDAFRSGTGPPSSEDIESPRPLPVEYEDFETLRPAGRSPLVVAHHARAATTREQHAMTTLFTLRPDHRTQSIIDSFFDAIDRWEAIHDHDHVLTVRARGSAPPWVATEFTGGGTLDDHVVAGLEPSLWFAHGLVRTVSHAHALGVIHGGLCPPAVRFTRTFGSTWPVPKVGDWGFAEVMADARLSLVPPAYAAPEHLEPESFGGIDHSTDVYGLGAVLYTLFTGSSPFVGDSHLVVKQVTSDVPPTPSDVNSDVPPEIDDFLRRAMAKRKSDRYETIEDLRVALERVIETHYPELMGRIY
ncbi:HEAT repeat domain-containing protein [Haladaptatus sp. DYF46]|uniref:protein kinase domain-containing protein n=1 Tax=Haladaptatus sp. DYF46 TaxID=2886041 RepID=UPI001E3448B2|nr:HEAT repeat domain-containing protein [Haladaptatus sp. DYF46]